jgi:hypothetical protein
MSIHSVDDFDPSSSTTATFGSTVSQTKIQQATNDFGGAEKLTTPPQPVLNGQNDATNNKNSDNLGNDSTQSVNGSNGTTNSTDVHVNENNETTTVDTLSSTNTTTKDNVNSAEESVSTSEVSNPIEKPSQNDPPPTSSNEPTGSVTSTVPPPVDPPAPTEPEPALSTSTDVAKEDLQSAPATNADNAPPVETTASTSNENVPASTTAPEATVPAQSATPEPKSRVINWFFFLILFLIFFQIFL